MTAPTLDAPQAVVVGDGTTAVARARTRWQKVRWPLATVVGFLVLVGLSSLLTARTSTTPLAPDNPGEVGARAVAEILRDQGVHVSYVRTVREARALAQPGTTLLVAGTAALDDDQVEALADVAADLVVVGPQGYHVPRLTGGAVRMDGPYMSGSAAASCTHPAAAAAEAIAVSGRALVAENPGVLVCFRHATGAAGGPAGAMAAFDDGDRRVVVVNDAAFLTNGVLAERGHAALALHLLGQNAELVWLVPRFEPDDGPGLSMVPDWLGTVALQLAVVVLAVGLWRGRRLGRVVVEPLPVTVRAAEATVGRGRLYRRARAYGHAAAALRAGTASRIASRLGLPRAAGAAEVIDAAVRATGRPREQVAGLLYGPPPTDDTGLTVLARLLDQLESEVHRT